MKTFNFLLLSIVAIGLYSCGPKMIYPGEVWTDTEQNMINAHGGGVLYHNGTYYWYGEYKNDSTYHAPGVEWDCYRDRGRRGSLLFIQRPAFLEVRGGSIKAGYGQSGIGYPSFYGDRTT